MVGAGVVFRGRDQREDARRHFVRVAVKDGVVGVREIRLTGVDDEQIMGTTRPRAVGMDGFQFLDVELAVNEDQPATVDDLLEHEQPAQDGFPDTGLPHDEAVPHEILVGKDERFAGIGQVAHQHPFGMASCRRLIGQPGRTQLQFRLEEPLISPRLHGS